MIFSRPDHSLPVMPGLVPGIHANTALAKEDVDGRDKPGHDKERNGVPPCGPAN
jgi:hypothetical protein